MQTHPLPTRPLLMQQLLDSRRVQPLALNRGTTVQRMRWPHLLLPNTLRVSLLLTKMLPPHSLSHPATNLLSHPANLPSHPATNLLTLTLSLLPRNRGTALGIVQSEVQEMFLLSHPATNLPSHPATNLPSHPATNLLSHPATNLLSHPATNLLSRPATNLLSHPATNLPSHPATNLPSHPATTMPLPLHSNRGTALLLMQAAQSAQRITLLVLTITFRSNPARATNPLPTRPLLSQTSLDSRRVQPLAHNRGTTVQRMRYVYLLLLKLLRISLLLLKVTLLPTRSLLLRLKESRNC
jgi:hypothetical protein